MRDLEGTPWPGSEFPDLTALPVVSQSLRARLDGAQNVLFISDEQLVFSLHAIALALDLWPDGQLYYWTEYDYIEDLSKLRKVHDDARRHGEDAVWLDYVAWEKRFLLMRSGPALLLDLAFHATTAYPQYEVHELLCERLRMGRSTMVAVGQPYMEAMGPRDAALLKHHFDTTVFLDDWGSRGEG